MLQFTDSNLDAALAPGQERTIRPLLLVDWLQDGLYNSPASSLTSDNLISVNLIDDVDSGLPDEVNGRPTASSTTLQATIHGAIGELSLWQLFSPWFRDSPYHGRRLEGSAVRYEMSTATTGGSTATRMFTGWIASVRADRNSGTVTITAKNNLHLLGHPVTLPRWARQTGVSYALDHLGYPGFYIPNEDRMENAPLTAAYLIQNVLRQCDAVPGPSIRSNAIWFNSGYGGMLPERGALGAQEGAGQGGTYMSQGIMSYNFPQNWGYPNYNRDILSFSELGFPSPFANADQVAGSSSDVFDVYGHSSATVEVLPTSGQPRFLHGGAWVRIPSGDSGAFVKQTVFFDPGGAKTSDADRAAVELVVGASNTTLTIRNSAPSVVRRVGTVSTPTTKDTLVYVSWEMDLQLPANMRIWYNNVLQSRTLSGALATYPTLDPAWVNDTVYRTQCRIHLRHAGFLNAEIWQSTNTDTGDRVPVWSNTDYQRKDFAFINGGFYGAQAIPSDYRTYGGFYEGGGYMPCVTHIPIRESVDAWELLKEMCAAFNMSMWIDAYGGLRIVTQGILGLLEQRLLDPRKSLDGDSLQGFSMNTAFDNVRDRIVYQAKEGRSTGAYGFPAYSAKTATQYTCGPGETVHYRISFPDETINVPANFYRLNIGSLGGGGWTYNWPVNNWGGRGFMATDDNGDAGTASAVWPVYCALQDVGASQSYVDMDIASTHTKRIWLAIATGVSPGSGLPSSPGLLLPGNTKQIDEVLTYSLGTGAQLLQIPLSEFHSAPWTMTKTYQALLARSSQQVPRAEDLVVPGDPRREIYDLLTLRDPDGGVDKVIAQIVGRQSQWAQGVGFQQTLTIRILFAPDTWLMEIDGFSEADQTTYFG